MVAMAVKQLIFKRGELVPKDKLYLQIICFSLGSLESKWNVAFVNLFKVVKYQILDMVAFSNMISLYLPSRIQCHLNLRQYFEEFC